MLLQNSQYNSFENVNPFLKVIKLYIKYTIRQVSVFEIQKYSSFVYRRPNLKCLVDDDEKVMRFGCHAGASKS